MNGSEYNDDGLAVRCVRLVCGVVMNAMWRPIDTAVRVVSVPSEKVLLVTMV